MAKAKILGSGVATLDIYPKQRRMYPGGNEYNVVCNAAFCGAEAGFMGVFGDDKAGQILEETLQGIGVDTSKSHHEKGCSGYCIVELKEDGDRVFLMWNQEGVTDLYPISFTGEEIAYVKSFDVFAIGRLADVSLERIRFLASRGVAIEYDFHARYTDADIEAIAPYVTYAFFSCGQYEEQETKRILKKAVDAGCRIAVGTSGVDPVLAYDGANWYRQETCKVKATDTLGAGDSYIGAFLANYLGTYAEMSDPGERIQKSLAAACAHSAHVVQIEGSIGIGYDVEPDQVSQVLNKADLSKGVRSV